MPEPGTATTLDTSASREQSPAVSATREHEVPSSPERWRSRRATVLALLVLAILLALPFRGLLRTQGPPMEEGFMLVFPERVLAGDLPNRDFLHLYGPGSLWFLAGAYATFGTSLLVERLVGLLQFVALISGLFALARPWGRPMATFVGAVGLLVIVPSTGLLALAWIGALALGVWAVWAALRARVSTGTVAGRWALVSGVLAGLALLYRPDLVLAVAGGTAAGLWGVGAPRLKRFAVGLALGLSPYLVHLVTAGAGTVIEGMLLDPVFELRGGRSLPIPPSPNRLAGFLQLAAELDLPPWPVETLTTAQQMVVWFGLIVVAVPALLAVGVWAVRRDRGAFPPRVLLAVAAFGVGCLPQAIQRTDNTHFAWASAVPIAFLAVGIAEVVRRWRPGFPALLRSGLAGVAVALVLLALIPTYTVRRWAGSTAETFGYDRVSFEITHNGRNFYYGRRDVAEALEEMLPVVDEVAPSDGRLFVGTHDLRRTPYSDAFLYFLFPDLDPATYYIEMDPGVADRAGSGLAEDLASADVAILSSVWFNWSEPNDSREIGSDEPVEVLADQFCRVGAYGQRRQRADATAGGALAEEAPPALYELFVKRPSADCEG